MSNLINSTVLKMNSFPGHEGRPGERGGSLPRGGSGGAGGSSEGKSKSTSKASSRTVNSNGNRASWSSSNISPLNKAEKFKDKELAQMVEQQIDGYERISVNCTTFMGGGSYSADVHHYKKNIEYFEQMAERHGSDLARDIAKGGREYWGYMSDYKKAASYTAGHIRDVYELKVAGKNKEAKAEAKKIIDKYQNDIKHLTPYLSDKKSGNPALTKVDIMMMKDCIQSVRDAASLELE